MRLGFKIVECLKLRVWGWGFGAEGLGFGVQHLRFRVSGVGCVGRFQFGRDKFLFSTVT